MKFEDFVKELEKARTAKEIYEIAKKIEKAPLLTKERNKLRKYVKDRVAKLGLDKEYFRVVVEDYLDNLRDKMSDNLYEAVDGYLTSFVPEHYQSWDGRMKNLRYVTSFIEYVARKRGKKIDLPDLELSNLRDMVDRFIYDYTSSDSHRKAMTSYMKQFGRYLERNLYVSKFPEPERIVTEKPPKEVRQRRMKGRARNMTELDLVMGRVGYRVEGKERKRAMELFFRFSLQTGQRPSQALLFTVDGLTEERGGAEWVTDVWGRPFVRLNFYEVVRAVKTRRGFKIVKKVPAGNIWVSEKLYRDLWDFVNDNEMPLDEGLFYDYLPLRTIENHCETLGKLLNVKKFSPYDFRHTWASVLYNASGYNLRLVKQMGSWAGESVPIDHYIEVMTPLEAVKIAKKYEIFLPPEIKATVMSIEAGERPEVKTLIEKIKELEEKLSRLEKGIR